MVIINNLNDMKNKNVLVLGAAEYAAWIYGPKTVHTVGIGYDVSNERIEQADIIIFTGGSDVDPKMYGHKDIASHGTHFERDIWELELYLQIQAKKKPLCFVIGICRGAQFLSTLTAYHNSDFNKPLIKRGLVQHVDNHGGYHTIDIAAPNNINNNKIEEAIKEFNETTTKEALARRNNFRYVAVSSTHHQMMLDPIQLYSAIDQILIYGYCYGRSAVYKTCDVSMERFYNNMTNAIKPEYENFLKLSDKTHSTFMRFLRNPELIVTKNRTILCQPHPEMLDGFHLFNKLLNLIINEL